MFSIAEISKTFITEHFTPLTSWVFAKQVTLTQAEIDDNYWVTWGGTIDYNQVNRSISSVYLDFTLNLAEMESLEDCQGQEESFYFDAVNQILYIHVTHTENPFAQTIETGLLFGYCSDKVRYFGNQEYKPILLSIPTITQSADPLQYDIMAFSGGSVVLSNDGEFDTFEKLYGNTIRLKIGKEGDDYTDLITIFSGYIKDYTTTTKDITIDIGDNREKLQIEYPTQVFSTLTGLAEDSNGQLIPDGYGTVIQVPAYPIEVGEGETLLTFDGVNDYVSIPYNALLNPTNQIRVEASAYMNEWTGLAEYGQHIVGCHQVGGYAIQARGGTLQGVSFSIYRDGGYKHALVRFSELSSGWHDFVGTYDGRYVKFYVDGELKDTNDLGSVAPIVYNNNVDLMFGADPNGVSQPTALSFFEGYIKDVALYSDAQGNNPIASWAINEGSGTTLIDSVGSHDGTINSASWVVFNGVRYRWATHATSITQVYIEDNDKLTSVSHGSFSTSGTFTLSEANAYIDGDNTKGLRKVYVTGVMRNITNPADIIVDLNTRLANIQYNSTNYNITEWEAEKALLADVSLYMDNSKSLYDWISLLQSGSTWGFRYEDTGKRTIRLDDPDRTQITFDDGTTLITPVEIRNSDIPINQNAELYATSCIVKYGYNHRTQSYSQVENTDYKDAVLQEHRIEKIITLESLLTSKTDAEAKALRIMQDQSKVRPIITLELEVSKYTTPRIYDIIQAEVSLLTRESRIPSLWSYVLGDMDILGDDLGLLGEVHKLTRTEAYTDSRGKRIYAGEMTCQVIGVEPLLETDEIRLRLRKIG